MIRCLRIVAGLSLSVLLAVTSITFALARGQHHGLYEVVICAGASSATIMVDADGQPAQPAPLCPECLGPALALPAPAAQPAAPAAVAFRLDIPRATLAAAPWQPQPRARGPPSASV